jgi:hypothetical protein
MDTALLGDLERRRAVGMLADDVGPLVDQGPGRVGLAAGIVPGVHPDDADLHLGVHLPRRELEGVDAHHHLGIGKEPI